MEIQDIYGLTFGVLVLTLVTIVAVVAIWQGLGTWRALKLASRDEVYRRFSESMAQSLRNIETSQAAIASDVSDIKSRNQRMELLLKQVE